MKPYKNYVIVESLHAYASQLNVDKKDIHLSKQIAYFCVRSVFDPVPKSLKVYWTRVVQN